MPTGILLDIAGDDDDMGETPIYSSPGLFPAEKRMVNAYTSPSTKIESTDEIIRLLSTARLTKLGHGTTSEGFIANTGTHKYIVRKTYVYSPQVRNHLRTELEVYKHIQQYPESAKYVSKLLYADVPLIHHKDDAHNIAYFVFEYKNGQPLDAYIEDADQPKKSFEEIMAWVTHLSNAILFLDSIGIYHRDIKPSNIFIDFETNEPLLFDFENACKKDSCTVSDFRGTRGYATPKALELLQQHSFKTYTYGKYYDFYSLAVLLEKDLVKITKGSDNQRLLEYAKHMKDQFRQFGGFKIISSSRKMRKIRTRRSKLQSRRKHTRKVKRRGGACPCSAGTSWFSK